jgi:hypothetical protein
MSYFVTTHTQFILSLVLVLSCCITTHVECKSIQRLLRLERELTNVQAAGDRTFSQQRLFVDQLSSVDAASSFTQNTDLPPWPSSLSGRNLIIAGDSNDRNFFAVLCAAGGHKPVDVPSLGMVSTSPYGDESMHFPPESSSKVCHVTERNASILFLFHFGVSSEAPEPGWHADCLLNRPNHMPQIGKVGKHVSSSDLAKFLWPKVVADHLPKRPSIFMTQSSLWDGVCYRDSKQQTMLETNQAQALDWLKSLGWRNRVGSYLRAAVVYSGLQFERILWRTNPNCPFRDAFLNSVTEAQSKEIFKLQAEFPFNLSIVDLRGHFATNSQRQCTVGSDRNGVHFSNDGHKMLLSLIGEALDERNTYMPPEDFSQVQPTKGRLAVIIQGRNDHLLIESKIKHVVMPAVKKRI